jgi:hypothetical protein
MSKHEEFPELTPEAHAAFEAALHGLDSNDVFDWRRALSAFLMVAMKQAGFKRCFEGNPGFNLVDIANNLHSPPPPPPTLAQAREAARQLGGANAEVVHAFLATLGEP